MKFSIYNCFMILVVFACIVYFVVYMPRSNVVKIAKHSKQVVQPRFTGMSWCRDKSVLEPTTLKKTIQQFLPSETMMRIYKKSVNIRDMSFIQTMSDESTKASTYTIPPQRTCAVVGSSGILLNSSCGEEIDNHDFVFRCNFPELFSKYTQDVGRKMNVTTINQGKMRQLYTYSVKGTLLPDVEDGIQFLNGAIVWYQQSFKSASVPRETVQVSLDYLNSTLALPFQFAFVAQQHKTLSLQCLSNTSKPTTGLVTVIVALSLCDEVTVYGCYPYLFGPDGSKVPFHYFGKRRKMTIASFNTEHSFNTEFEFLESLHRNGALRLVAGRCK